MKYFDMSLNYLSQNRTNVKVGNCNFGIKINILIRKAFVYRLALINQNTIEITNVWAQQIYTIYLLLNYKTVLSQSHFYPLVLFKPHSYGFEIKRLFAFGKFKYN